MSQLSDLLTAVVSDSYAKAYKDKEGSELFPNGTVIPITPKCMQALQDFFSTIDDVEKELKPQLVLRMSMPPQLTMYLYMSHGEETHIHGFTAIVTRTMNVPTWTHVWARKSDKPQTGSVWGRVDDVNSLYEQSTTSANAGSGGLYGL